MSREWYAVYVGMIGRPKYRRLSLEARAALFHVWCLAGGQTPEATWRSVEEFLEVLELDGYPAAVFDELVDRMWLDVDTDGRVLVHDWDQHQLAATNSARRIYERDRKREWRRSKPGGEANPPPPAPPSPDITGATQAQDTTTQESPNVPDASRGVPGVRSVRVNGRSNVPTEGECDVCGGQVRDTDYGAKVGPGWIAHGEHPDDYVQ
jgi:hypothetical protein